MQDTTQIFLTFSVNKLRQLEDRIEICVNKLSPDQVWARGHKNENAVGNLLLHLAGNVRQWIVSSLGEQPDHRERDAEFAAQGGIAPATLLAQLRGVVNEAAAVIESCTPEKLVRFYQIQTHRVSGLEVIYHVVEHFALHTGQIIFVTKMLTTEELGFYSYLIESKPTEQVP